MDEKEKLSREQMEEIVIREIKRGTKQPKIAELIGSNVRMVANIKKELEKTGRLKTREQIEAIIKERLKNGISYEKIAEETGKSIAHISNVKKKLKAGGEITDEDIEKAKKKIKEESLEEYNNTVLEGLLNGETNEEIADRIGKSESWVSDVRKRLNVELKVTEEQIEKARKNREVKRLQSAQFSEDEKAVIKYITIGKNKSEISKQMEKDYDTISRIVNRLTSAGILTEEYIEKGKRERRYAFLWRDPVMQQIRELLKQGISIHRIESIVLLDEGQIDKYVKEFIDFGLITQEEIDIAREENRVKRDNIIELLRQGFSYKEIKEQIEISDEEIQEIEKKAISWKKFTREDLKKARKLRKDRLTQRSRKNLPEKLKKARRIIDLDRDYKKDDIKTLKQELIKELNEKAEKEEVTRDELKTIDELMFMADIDVDAIIDNARLHVKALDFDGALKFLNFSKSFINKKDKDKVDEMYKTVDLTIRRTLAQKLLQEESDISVSKIQEYTGLSTVEVLRIKREMNTKFHGEPDIR